MDFDGDGIPDILSGSEPGELYFFRGEGKGKFAAPQTLKDKDGKDLFLDFSSTVFAFDWNADGLLDLLVGGVAGEVSLVLNQGTAKQPAFGKGQQLRAAGKVIHPQDDYSHPVAADWDGDGLPDLVVGCGDGSVVWYRNAGKRAEPKLVWGGELLAAPKEPADSEKPRRGSRGSRAKVCVTDWNGDGRPDLLVGDHSRSVGEKPKLTDADRAALKAAQEKADKLEQGLPAIAAELLKKLGPPPAVDRAQLREWQKKCDAGMLELKAKHKKTFDELDEIQKLLIKFEPPVTYDGLVWLLLGANPQK